VATDHLTGRQHSAAYCTATCAKPSRSPTASLPYLHAQCLMVAPTAGPTASAACSPLNCPPPQPPQPPQIYAVCQSNGRIAYKRAGGSRLITHNEHWKSQIRHALYTGERFQRCVGRMMLLMGSVMWQNGCNFRHALYTGERFQRCASGVSWAGQGSQCLSMAW